MTVTAEIIETVVRYECPKCGNNCRCGVPYVPKTARAAEAIRAHPEKSNRAIADEIGADEKTVRKARADQSAPAAVTGRDGKQYPARAPRQERSDEDVKRGEFVFVVETSAESAKECVDFLNANKFTRGSLPKMMRAVEKIIAKWQGVLDILRTAGPSATPAEMEREAECIALAQKAGVYQKANPTDTEVAAFDTLVRELLRGLKGQKPQRFAKTTVALPLLGDLASFIREVVAIRKLADDPSASAEKRKADYAASEASA
jgi:hypothetical protein